MNKDNCIKAIKWEDIEIPVEYLKQTTVNISGDDYIRLQQENLKYKEVINKLKRYIEGCLELSPIEDRNVTDDVLDKELKYLLKIIKEVLG